MHFRNIILSFFVFLFLHENAVAQITVGDSTSSFVRYVRLDTSINAGYGSTANTYSCDVDGDGTMDVAITGYDNGAMGSNNSYTGVNILNNIFQLVGDQTYPTYTDTLKRGSIINNTLNWVSSSLYLTNSGYYHTNSPPYIVNYSYGLFYGQNNFLGFRVTNSSDTLYGWFLLGGYGIKIKSYAIQKTITGVKELKDNNIQVNIYPNPSNNYIHIVSTKNMTEIKLVNVLGKEIINTTEKNIDVSNLQEGVYFVQVKMAEGIATKKIIVQK